MLDQYPEVKKRHFNIEADVVSEQLKEVTGVLRSYLSSPGKTKKIKEILLQNPQIFPIERCMFYEYDFRARIQVPEGGIVDCFAARPDSGGIRGYMYYLGSPYDDPFMDSGQPGRELKSLLELTYSHASLTVQLLSPKHILHPISITGEESAGMKQKYFHLRTTMGFGPYAELNIYIVVGQRDCYSDLYELNRFQSMIAWKEKFSTNNRLYVNGCNVKLEILSYTRLIKSSS